MSEEISILKYAGTPPSKNAEIVSDQIVSLGTVRELKTILERHSPLIEWEIEPSLLFMMQQSGSNLWRDWDAELLASRSHPRLNGHIHSDSLSLSILSLSTDEEADVSSLLVEVRSVGNPYKVLQTLCEENGWIAYRLNPNDELVDFAKTNEEWEDWQENEERYLEESRERRAENQKLIESQRAECQRFLETIVHDGNACPKCRKHHTDWRCVVPDDPFRCAYFVCRECGKSSERDDFEAAGDNQHY
jgi:hypothetical protein